jgi:hypothetical protein
VIIDTVQTIKINSLSDGDAQLAAILTSNVGGLARAGINSLVSSYNMRERHVI